MSSARLEVIAKKLKLNSLENEIFLLSAELESATTSDSNELKNKLKHLIKSLNAQKSTQQNAWYFGAVQALQKAGIDPCSVQEKLGLTSLQIDNALRFIKRIQKLHPEIEALSYDPSSVFKKLNESFVEGLQQTNTEFVLLSGQQAEELKLKMKSVISKFKRDLNNSNADDLTMVHISLTKILKED